MKQIEKPRFSAPALAVLRCLAATLTGLVQPKAAAGGADSVSAVAAETGQKVQEVTQAAESRLEHHATDPAEPSNMWELNMDQGFMLAPVLKTVGEYQQSMAKYRNVKTGEDFEGYTQ